MKSHGWELAALWSLAMSIIGSMVWMAFQSGGSVNSSHGVVIAALSPVLPMAFNSIRGLGQTRAMQTMVDQLGKSAPVADGVASGKPGDPIHQVEDPPLDLGGMEQRP